MIIKGQHAIAGQRFDAFLRLIGSKIGGKPTLASRIDARILIDLQVPIDALLRCVATGREIIARLLRCRVGALPIRRLRLHEAAAGEEKKGQERSAHWETRGQCEVKILA